MERLTIGIIISTIREGRFGETAARWIRGAQDWGRAPTHEGEQLVGLRGLRIQTERRKKQRHQRAKVRWSTAHPQPGNLGIAVADRAAELGLGEAGPQPQAAQAPAKRVLREHCSQSEPKQGA